MPEPGPRWTGSGCRDATWEWTVEVETWEPQGNADGTTSIELLQTDPWTIGYTDVDPRQVEYGSVKGSPDRAEMLRRYWSPYAGRLVSEESVRNPAVHWVAGSTSETSTVRGGPSGRRAKKRMSRWLVRC